MGLDINLFRTEKGGNPDKVRESQAKRYPNDPSKVELVDQVIQADQDWRKRQFDTEQCRKDRGKVQKEIGQRKKASKGQDKCEDLLAKKVELDNQITQLEEVSEEARTLVDTLLKQVGNIVHDDIVVDTDEANNAVIRTWGEPRNITIANKPGFLNHHKVLALISGYDPKRGQKVAGHRGYFLTGYGALLNMALVQYGMKFLFEREYTPIQTPFFMKREIMAETAQLSEFDETLYKLSSKDTTEEKDEKYLIATAEQPISGYFRHE